MIAIDGKTVRGARTATTAAPHLVAGLDHATGATLGHVAVDAKSNGIPAVRDQTVGVVYLITSADHTHADPATLASWVRQHWGIENKLH